MRSLLFADLMRGLILFLVHLLPVDGIKMSFARKKKKVQVEADRTGRSVCTWACSVFRLQCREQVIYSLVIINNISLARFSGTPSLPIGTEEFGTSVSCMCMSASEECCSLEHQFTFDQF